MMRIIHRTVCVIALAATLILLPARAAQAHVTVRADNTAPGSYAKYTVRVPNESDTASTTKIELKLPAGFEQASVQPKPGWTVQLANAELIISGGKIAPGQFDEFSFSARNPETAADLTFPAIQTYDDGTVANWIGQPGTDEPAPVVKIAGTPEADGGGAEHAGAQPSSVETSSAQATPSPASNTAMPMAIAALLVGLLGVGIGGAAFVRARHA
jgi:periplasmic copper chaperone A